MISHPSFAVEPWSLRATHPDLDVLAQTESVFSLSNRHIGWRAINLDEGEPNAHSLRIAISSTPGTSMTVT